MTVDQMRSMISKVYPNDDWYRRVKFMPEVQVMAVYYSFLRNGKFDKSVPIPKKEDDKEEWEQMHLSDFIIL